MKLEWILVGLAVVGMAGCKAVGPEYKKPAANVPARYGAADGNSTRAKWNAKEWWGRFHDPELTALVKEAAVGNPDIKAAEARISEARAIRGIVAADGYPEVSTSASYTRQRFSENGIFPLQPPEMSDWRGGFDASWELDLFGRTKRAVQAANRDIEVAQANRRGVAVALSAEVARNYVLVRSYQDRLGIAANNIKTQKDSLEIVEARYNSGMTSELNVSQAKAQLATTEASVPQLQTGLAAGIHRLSVLLGKEPGALRERLMKGGTIPMAEPSVPVGLPSELLRRRPDVVAAERALAAQTARIGVATADLYPRFSLTGSWGLSSRQSHEIFDSASQFWSLGPGLQWPVFDAGRIRANIRAQNARQRQALAQYEKTVLNSLEDVENALVAYGKEQERRERLKEAVGANKRSLEIANDLYVKGLADYLNVLDAQRTLYTAQDQLSQSEAAVATDLAALYKALGGGF